MCRLRDTVLLCWLQVQLFAVRETQSHLCTVRDTDCSDGCSYSWVDCVTPSCSVGCKYSCLRCVTLSYSCVKCVTRTVALAAVTVVTMRETDISAVCCYSCVQCVTRAVVLAAVTYV